VWGFGVRGSGLGVGVWGFGVRGSVFGCWGFGVGVYRGTSLIKKTPPLLEPCSKTISRVLWWSSGEVLLLMTEVPL
jgi:hypothetical protein